jgi:hypothetical protein
MVDGILESISPNTQKVDSITYTSYITENSAIRRADTTLPSGKQNTNTSSKVASSRNYMYCVPDTPVIE